MRISVQDLASAAGGSVIGDATVAVEGLGVDTRALSLGAGFVALVAERDGHDFAPAAVDAGATAILAARPLPGVSVPVVEVADTGAALLDVGRLARRRLPERVVGITGSVGKTSTKDLLAAVLAARWTTAASAASFNNEIGVPLTLAGAPEDTEAVVVEMGARGIGHVALLCDVARPTAAVVTAVAPVHLEMFGTVDGVARAKGELVEALPADGVAVLNADDARVAAMAERTSARVLTYGMDASADVRAEDLILDALLRPRLRLTTPWGAASVTLAVHGAHQAANALAAAACGLALGVELDAVVDALGTATVSGLRMQIERTPSGAVVVNDAYNANPTSTRAALDALAALPGEGQKVAVLGIMAELGPDGDRLHAEVAAEAAARGIRVISVGAADYQVEPADAVADVDTAVERLGALGEGDSVLVKGSRVAALERVAGALMAG